MAIKNELKYWLKCILRGLLVFWVLFMGHSGQVLNFKENCRNIKGVGNPSNIFHIYFKQTMNVFNPQQKDTEVKLLYYRKQKAKVEVHRYVFKLKNTYANRYEYVGIVSVVPKKEIVSGRHKHFIIRYINTSDLLDAQTLLGVYEAKKDKPLMCANMKKDWLNYLIKNPYIVTKCKVEDRPECITSASLTKLFSEIFNLVTQILQSFGIEVSTGELGYDKTVLNIFLDVFKDFKFVTVSP